MTSKILAAIDRSAGSDRVFQEAVTLAKALDASLMLLHVISPFEDNYPDIPIVPGVDAYYPLLYDRTAEVYLKRLEAYEQDGMEFLRDHAEAANSLGVATEFTQAAGDPGRAICALAKGWDADLIVLGRRGRSGLNELLLGSVSNYVLHHAPCSVLTIQGRTESTEVLAEEKDAAIAR